MSLQQFLWLFFSFSGRVNRAAYALAGMLLYLLRIFPVYKLVNAPDEVSQAYWGTVFVYTAVVSLVAGIPLTAKRLQDIGRPGWFAGFYVIADILLYIPLCFIPGESGPNRYGKRTNAPRD